MRVGEWVVLGPEYQKYAEHKGRDIVTIRASGKQDAQEKAARYFRTTDIIVAGEY